jgi:hypothetical protein
MSWGYHQPNAFSHMPTNVKHTWELVILLMKKELLHNVFCTPCFGALSYTASEWKQNYFTSFLCVKKSSFVTRKWMRRWLLERLCFHDSQNVCSTKIQWNHLAYKDTFYCSKTNPSTYLIIIYFLSYLPIHTWNLFHTKIEYQGETKLP